MDTEIQEFKTKIARHEQRIEQIEAHADFKMAEEPWISLVKAEQDQILALRAELLILRQLQQPISSSSSGRCFTFR